MSDPIFTPRMPPERCLATLRKMQDSILLLLLPAKYWLALSVAVRAVEAAAAPPKEDG